MHIVHNTDGVTLVETLVALMIFSLGMLGAAGLTIVLIQGNTFSHMLTTATILAQNKLEVIQDTVYTAITGSEETVLADDHGQYTRTVNVTKNQPAAGMKTVEVVVSWQVPAQRQHSVVLKTIVADLH